MKTMFLLFTFFFFASSCGEEKQTEPQESSIYGTWQLIKQTANNADGSPNGWQDIKDGRTITFNENLTYKSEITPHDCNEITTSTFEIRKESEIKALEIIIMCINPNMTFKSQYSYSFQDSTKLILVPIEPACVEGCAFLYKKINE
ncbi:MAG: hypothetical protein P8H63_04365 [Flavobacteriaceae bacterium]|nr:hypothetical protein [Flavobacteriaceae bacterium]